MSKSSDAIISHSTSRKKSIIASASLEPSSRERKDFIKYFPPIKSDELYPEMNNIEKALISCLAPIDACELFKEGLVEQLGPRSPLLAKISNDIREGGLLLCHKRLINELLGLVRCTNYRTRQSAAKDLNALYMSLPSRFQRRVVDSFLDSSDRWTRHRAYINLLAKWLPACLPSIERAWKNYADLECLGLITRHMPDEWMEAHLSSVIELYATWTECWQVRAFYLRISRRFPNVVEALRDHDSITYAYIRTMANRPFTHDEALALYALTKEQGNSRIPILIWCFGRQKLWTVLQKIIDSPIESRIVHMAMGQY